MTNFNETDCHGICITYFFFSLIFHVKLVSLKIIIHLIYIILCLYIVWSNIHKMALSDFPYTPGEQLR